MSAYDHHFRLALSADLDLVHERGLDASMPRETLPALSELAEHIAGVSDDGSPGYWREVVEATLHTAIARLDDPKEREGLTLLLGLGTYPGGDLTRRRDEAAISLNLSGWDSLRKTMRGGVRLERLLLNSLLEQLLILASERRFTYSALRTWSAFYPERPVYDYNSHDYDHGRYGATKGGPVFNSFINTPSYGDERLFLDGRRTDQSAMESYDPVRDVTIGAGQVELRMYVDNMAAVFPHDPSQSTAHGARVRIWLPTGTGSVLRARGYIWANNAEMVEDTVDLLGAEPFRVEYIEGSAVLKRGNFQYSLSDTIVEDEGALIGHIVMDGVLPAGNQFETAALVFISVRIITSNAPA